MVDSMVEDAELTRLPGLGMNIQKLSLEEWVSIYLVDTMSQPRKFGMSRGTTP